MKVTPIIIGLSSLHGLFSDRPSATSLPADLNAQLITALYEYKPNISDSGNVTNKINVLSHKVPVEPYNPTYPLKNVIFNAQPLRGYPQVHNLI